MSNPPPGWSPDAHGPSGRSDGQQGAGAPGHEPPQRSSTPLIAAAVALVLVLSVGGIVAAILLTGDGDDSSASDDTSQATGEPEPDGSSSPDLAAGPTIDGSPEDSVRGYLDALLAQDCFGMRSHLTGSFKDSFGCEDLEDPDAPGFEAEYRIEDTMESGDTATVTTWHLTMFSGHGVEITCTFDLLHESRSWLIQDIYCQGV